MKILNEAGIKIKAKGVDYKRTYSFGFKSQNTELANLQEDNAFSRSSWNSNISLSVDNGRHVQTQRILSKDQLNLSTYNHDGFGLYMQNGVGYFSPEHNIATNRVGDGDWNFIANSGLLAANTGEFAITVSSPQSGVNLFQRFLNDTDAYTFDKGVEQWDGFQMGYISILISHSLLSSMSKKVKILKDLLFLRTIKVHMPRDASCYCKTVAEGMLV